MIIDGHAHISDSTYGNVELYLEALKAAGIDHGVVVPGGMVDVRRMSDYISGKVKPDSVIPNNPYVAQACQAHGGLTGYICIDPHEPNSAAKLEEGFKSGFRGLKLSPLTHQFAFSSKAVAELISLCGEYGYPVYSHTVFSPGSSSARFIALAKQFPKTNFILGHMGFGPADQEGLQAAIELENFYLETSNGSFLHIQETVNKAGASKVIFGSEFPLSDPGVELYKVQRLKVSDEQRAQILGGNIARLLGLKI